MNKIKFSLLFLCITILTPLYTLAANDVGAGSGAILTIGGNNFTLGTNTSVQSFTVDTNNVQFIVEANSVVSLTSSNRSGFAVTSNNRCSTASTCTNSASSITLTCSGDVSQHTITLTPSGTCSSISGYSIILLPSIDKEGIDGFAIDAGAQKTDTTSVTLNFNYKDADKIAISNSNSFEGVSFEDYASGKEWKLELGNGIKQVYTKIMGESGGSIIVSDSIELTDQEHDSAYYGNDTTDCNLETGQAYKNENDSAVYYVTKDCAKRAFKRSDVFFTYFDSWSDVVLVSETQLDSTKDDALGFMPWGPKYDPKYGALVKTVTDPKVYLLLGTEKYWITAESIFNSLNYSWDWIEDIDEALLDKYSVGSEIDYTDRHPNYTIIKYENDPKVYRLEDGKKRHVKDETAFESLNFRWDRIVTIDEAEIYPDGTVLD
ncbi:MAG: hypothetical protein HOA57_00795 [Candidatus Magasanikbacteria bacterium]|jgi:hypothetical protein|nr:hypothetical protein [Candidatus Magasanikbacteria bacterium]MBT6818910.1 hypothetical protein [Candidatus Magasanikbacteria bacterium]